MSAAPRPRRHLPVLGSERGADPEGGARAMSPGRWVLVGLLPTYLVWVPLAGLAASLSRRLLRGTDPAQVGLGLQLSLALAQVLAFSLAAMAGGFVITWLGQDARVRHSARSGALAATLAWALAWLRGDLGALALPLLLVVVAVGAGAGALGGWRGLRSPSQPT